ncbi:CAP domain-containing protein [Aurantimonas sp. 22II-16-19i]|uniref:CAP domain-containing protein n=1 Tax=Aurantimonas sp. 22II-16-19i TaxID=1317114 RepID=UPI0009F7F464|nr:CAP domain-containing protein [Aurantimonas sp. 22II-16-19i]ORE93827.1 allergen V5/Tpx-1-like protein [Aurantimonas sp. 22II-16-19i]
MITAAEQYLIELINRARLDPQGEADRYLGGNLDANNGGDAFGAHSRQPLAGNDALNSAAAAHSLHMLAVDQFAHEGIGDGTATERMVNAGYPITGFWGTGENISVRGTTGTINLDQAIEDHHSGLFVSIGHRTNILNGDFRELGVGQEQGAFSGFGDGVTYDSSMLTEKFAYSGSRYFLTGVVYADTDNDDFYSIGEGVGGRIISIESGGATTSATAGGYDIAINSSGVWANITSESMRLALLMTGQNVKLDFIGSNAIASSASINLRAGGSIVEVLLLGTDNLIAAGTNGNETLIGNAGNNVLRGGFGADHLDGGAGFDRADYDGSNAGILVNLGNGTGRFGHADGDTLTSIEAVRGTSHADTLLGSSAANTFWGLGSADILRGYAGNDRLEGGDGNDQLFGDFNADTLLGGAGDDTLAGGAGGDYLDGGVGNDTITGDADGARDIFGGGAGIDTLDYSAVTSAITVDLVAGLATGAAIGTDRLFGIERVLGGSGDDQLTGNGFTTLLGGGGGNNSLWGGTGNDNIRGYAGFDVLNGGAGNDRLQGDANADTFVFGNGFGKDIIADFEATNAAEKIDLSAVTAITSFADLAANHLTQVGGNAVITDGFNTITLNGVNIADLDATDFIF